MKQSGPGAERPWHEDPAIFTGPGLHPLRAGYLESDRHLSPGLLETTVQKVARVKAPNKSLPSAVYCIEDKM